MYIDNNWYGNRFVLSKYCNTNDKPTIASIQHGLFFPESLPKNKYLKKTFNTPWLVWNKNLEKHLKKLGIKNVISIGSPFIYANEIYKKNKNIKSKGTLIIPAKSSNEVDLVVDYKSLVKFIKKKLPGPYTVMVGYLDYQRLKKERIKINNCKFVTCGRRGDITFTKKLIQNIKSCQNIAIFYAGSPILYSLFYKKRTFFYTNVFLKNYQKIYDKKKLIKEIKNLKKQYKFHINLISKNYKINFKNLNTLENYKNSRIALGEDCKFSKEKLMKILGWNNDFKTIIARLFGKILNLKYYKVSRYI